MNTRNPLSVHVINVLGEMKSDQNFPVIPAGAYEMIELPNGNYRLQGQDRDYEVDGTRLHGVLKNAKVVIHGKWV